MSENDLIKQQRIERICPACRKQFLALLSEISRGGGVFCSQPCYHQSRAKSLTERFWAMVNKTPTCWLWIGGTNRSGTEYGNINNGTPKKTLLAHRVSWEIHFGPIPDGMEVCHNCPGGDNSLCVNPDHLFLGTHADNMRDASIKKQVQTGENHHNAKLTWAIVRAMRERYRQGDITMTALASEFRRHPSTTQNVLRGITWKE